MIRLLWMTLIAAGVLAAETPHDIVAKSAQAMLKADHAEDEYTYNIREVQRELDRDGTVKATHETEKESIVFAGKRIERLMAKDGKPLPEKDARKEQDKLDHAAEEASKLSESQLKERIAKRDREEAKDNEWLTHLADAFHLTLLREETLNGRPVYVIQALPDSSYQGKDASLFHRVKGMLYIDKQFYTLARLQGEVLDNISFGLFLAKIDKGTHFEFQQVRVNDEVWLPQRVTYKAEARALIKSVRVDGEVEFSDYKRFRTDSKIVSTAAPQ